MSAVPAVRPALVIAAEIGVRVQRMIEIQMSAYPNGWTDAERRDSAVRHLFGREAARG